MDSVIQIQDLSKSYGDKQILTGLSFGIKKGSIFGLLGPNGAGKTTTLRMLSCLLAPSSGNIQILGYQVGQDNDQIRRKIGAVTESPGVYDKLSIIDNLEFFAACYELPNKTRDERIESLLKYFDLWEKRDQLAGRLSKGQKQKVAIIRALLPDPEIILLDEATANLDPVSIRKLKDLVLQYAKEGKTIIYCSHTLTEIDELCTEFAIIKGKLLTLTTPAEFRHQWSTFNLVLNVAGEHEKTADLLRSLTQIQTFERRGDKFHLKVDDPATSTPALLKLLVEANIPVIYLEQSSNSLEDAYLSMLQGGTPA